MHPLCHVRALCAAAALTACAVAQASDLDAINQLAQSEFRTLSRDIAAAVSFKPLVPSEATGVTGFDLGFTVGATRVGNESVIVKAAGGDDIPASIPYAGVRLHKGLPLNLDVGISYHTLPSTGVRATGGELRWAVLPGSALLPAVALRLSAASLGGVDNLRIRTTGYDVSVSKGFAFVTPYVGVGRVRARASAPGISTLRDESFDLDKWFAGVNFGLGMTNLVVEVDKTGDARSYGFKVGLRF
jgi:hypothetical protein